MRPEASGVGIENEKSSPIDVSRAGEALLADLLANTTELLSLYDRDFRLTHYAARLKGLYGGAVVPGAAIWEIYPSFLDTRCRDEFLRVFQGGSAASIELPRSSGEAPRSVFVFGTADGVGVIESQGRGGRSTAEEQEHVILLHQATHDVLTGLQNRRRFGERLQEALAAIGGPKPKAALLQIDLDDFKSVNDTLGHGAGDTLLQLAAGRIRDALQDGESAYRYAGDEFAVIQLGKEQPMEAERLA
ncbi:MAG: GGDEF domain-containing protein, partial [Mesorhizobium sp.]